jgi:Domain of unknown function (DUF5666)
MRRPLLATTALAVLTLLGVGCSRSTAAAPPAASAPPAAAPQAAATPQAPPAGSRTWEYGTVQGLQGDTLTLDGGKTFTLAETTNVSRQEPLTPADLQAGQYVGVTAKRQPDNTLLASEVNVIPQAGAEFQMPMGGGNLMTNGTIAEVNGNTFTVSFQGGGARITLAPDAHVYRIERGSREDIKTGKQATVVSSDGKPAVVLLHD